MYRQSIFKSKYGAIKQNGFDSKFESSYADELELQKKAGTIFDYETQFKVSFDANGKHIANYFVDFRVHELNGSFTLVETKGFETDVWKLKRRLLEALWLPEHPDHEYIVVKQRNYYKSYAKRK